MNVLRSGFVCGSGAKGQNPNAVQGKPIDQGKLFLGNSKKVYHPGYTMATPEGKGTGGTAAASAGTREEDRNQSSGIQGMIPVDVRHDGLGTCCMENGVIDGAYATVTGLCVMELRFACDGLFLNIIIAEYLKIHDIRDKLEEQDSPFVANNNAGGGFGGFLKQFSCICCLLQ